VDAPNPISVATPEKMYRIVLVEFHCSNLQFRNGIEEPMKNIKRNEKNS
jgi:hypothetical protein